MNRKQAREKAIQLVNRMTVEEAAGQLRYDAPAIERLGVVSTTYEMQMALRLTPLPQCVRHCWKRQGQLISMR